jgi:hypothetical protein
MGLNFPNSPTSGQVYSPYAGGPVYMWDSTDKVWRFSSTAPPGSLADAPSDGKVYARENAVWVPIPKITSSTASPTSPDVGDLWIDTSGLGTLLVLPPPVVSLTAVYITDAPSDNKVYARENTAWIPMPKITSGTTAPTSPDVNDLWVDTT